MVRIRLKKVGRRNRPHFRIAVADIRAARDGLTIEEIGWIDPSQAEEDQKVHLKTDRAEYWLSRGASPSDAVVPILKKKGVKIPGR